MATRTERIEARLSRRERERIGRAAALEGESVSSFMVAAATERATQVITARTTTVLPSEYFDRLLSAIDDAGPAPRLARVAKRARRRRRIG